MALGRSLSLLQPRLSIARTETQNLPSAILALTAVLIHTGVHGQPAAPTTKIVDVL